MAKGPALGVLFERLGREVDRDLIERALTHPAGATAARPDYERLEFLGDRVLGLVIAEALLAAFPDEPEGKLAPRLAVLVSRETCAEVAEAIDLGAHLRLDAYDARTGGRKRARTLGDAMEAVIGAVHLDGGIEAARALVLRLWAGRIAGQGAEAPRDAKSRLQEWSEGRGLGKPDYVLVSRQGPDHRLRFEVEARVATGAAARAVASSKQAAEKAAAAALLEQLSP